MASYKDLDDWREDAATNVTGVIHVLDASRQVRGAPLREPANRVCFGRPHSVPIPFDHPCRLVVSYGISKTAGEQYVAAAGLPSVSLRLARVIGQRLAIGAIPTFHTRVKASKSVFCTTAVRDFLDMSDFRAFLDLDMNEAPPTGIYDPFPRSIQSPLPL